MIGAIVHQLTRDLTEEQIRTAGFDTYFVDRTAGVYPTAASGFPYSAASMAVKGDLIADLTEDLAAEQKARVTYDNILRLSDDPDVNDVIKFLRAREIVHFQRFGEGLRLAKDCLLYTSPAPPGRPGRPRRSAASAWRRCAAACGSCTPPGRCPPDPAAFSPWRGPWSG